MTASGRASRIAVLGAGLQGCCLALELAARGVDVDLYERNPMCMAEASTNNEGKIHLGFVYAKDQSLETARRMADGAMAFETLLRRWLDSTLDGVPVSRPFTYAVHRQSQIAADAFEAHARKVTEYLRLIAGGRPYFGRDVARMPERLDPTEHFASYSDEIIAAFQTEEIAIDPVVLAEIIRDRLASEPRLRCLTACNVDGVADDGERMRVIFMRDGVRETGAYDRVVNAAWAGRLSIDAGVGLEPPLPWSHRLKYGVRGRPKSGLAPPSTTIVLGPFGDAIDFGDGPCYLSWYPVSLREWSVELAAPRRPGLLIDGTGDEIADGVLSGLRRIMPGLGDLEPDTIEVCGNWIFAWGDTDIDDSGSLLHKRSQIGIRTRGRFMTIDTGKLTMAPYYAMKAAEMLVG